MSKRSLKTACKFPIFPEIKCSIHCQIAYLVGGYCSKKNCICNMIGPDTTKHFETTTKTMETTKNQSNNQNNSSSSNTTTALPEQSTKTI